MRVAVLVAILLIVPIGLARGGTPTRDFLLTAGNDVVTIAQDGGDRVSLNGGTGIAADPQWSPDGTQVVLTKRDSSGQGLSDLYIAAADGSSSRRLTFDATASDGAKADPQWSPDGMTIAYLAGFSGHEDVWTIPAAGGTPRRLTAVGDVKSSLGWSRDGTKLVYADANSGNAVIHVIDAVSGRQLWQTGGVGPVWSPDGSRIAYVDSPGRASVIGADGSNPVELTQILSSSPTWSPDGSRVVFTGTTIETSLPVTRFGPTTRIDLYSVPADGSGDARRLTGPFSETDVGGMRPSAPSVSPDGTAIAFHNSADPVPWQVNADGTCARPLMDLGPVTVGPLWRPGSAAGPYFGCVDLYATATADPPQAALGQQVQLRIVVENHGNEVASEVEVDVTAPNPASTLGGCAASGCVIRTLQPGASSTVYASVSSLVAGNYPVHCTVTATPSDITPADATGATGASVLPCTIVGSWGADHLVGTRGNDRICGLPGPDWISGGAGDDYINGGSGNDTIFGGKGHDTILGGGGRDVIFARDGQLDWIDCGTEYDVAVVDKIDHVRHCERVLRK